MVEMNRQQAEALKEKLSQMSPEELKEFQKKQCIFCQIIAGKVASKKVYSDDKCTAILDINPANPGHILLIPNEHYSIMPLMPPEELGHLFKVAKALCQASLKALEAQGTNIFVANGVAAGQKAQHFMIHIIPRKEGDNVKLAIPEKTMSEADSKQVIARLKPAIEKMLGAREKKEEEKKAPKEEKAAEKKEAEEAKEEKKEKPEEKEAKPRKYITSEKARRFHTDKCPFAQKIPEDSRVYVTEDEAETKEKLPCSCTGIKKEKEKPKKKLKMKEEKEPEEELEEKEEETEEETEEPEEEEPEEEAEEKEGAEEGISLDDIGRLLTGGA